MINVPQRGPTTPGMRRHTPGLGSSPFARHYWGKHGLFSLPGGTKVFQFPPLASLQKVMMTALHADGLSHSEIRGSRDICSLPRLIAAYHVLHRLCEPRHPPCALTYFISPTPASTMLLASHPQSVITLILSAVFFVLRNQEIVFFILR